MKDLLTFLQTMPRELILSAGCGALILFLMLFLWFILRHKKKASDIGLRRVETNFPDSNSPFSAERREPEADFSSDESFDPLENAVTPPSGGTQVFERVFEPVTTPATHVVRETIRPAVSSDHRSEPVLAEERSTLDPRASEPSESPRYFREEAAWSFLETLPFRMRQGLKTMHADMVGIGVEAVFFDPSTVNRLSDPVMRLVPFLPDGEILVRESDRKTFLMGSLHAQPDAVIETSAGLLSVEYKSKSGRSDDPTDLRRTIRTKDLLQTLIEAMVLSTAMRRPVAPILRTHNAVYFLRPERRIMKLLSESIVPAEDFIAPYSTQSGISASDYAALCTVAAERLFAAPVTERHLAGEEAHKRMIG